MRIRKSPSGALAQTGSTIAYRPGGETEGIYVSSWSAVENEIAANEGFVTVYLDDSIESITIPADADVDCLGRTVFLGGTGEVVEVVFADGAQLRNPARFGNLLVLAGAPTVRPFLAFSGESRLELSDSQLGVTGGTEPAINLVDGDEFSLVLFNSSVGDGANAVINCEDGSSLEATLFLKSVLLDDSVSGGAASGVEIEFDASSAGTQPFANLLSTADRSRIDEAGRLDPASGDTASRPTGDNVATGQMYFDTDLGQPIWWDGAQWVDATGAPA